MDRADIVGQSVAQRIQEHGTLFSAGTTKSFWLVRKTPLDILSVIGFKSFYPVPAEGAFHERQETRGGMRWPCRAKDVSRDAEAQAAMIRLTGRGSPAEDTKTSRPVSPGSRCLSSGVVAEQASNTARGTPTFSAVRGATNLMRILHTAHGAMGWPESPAFRAPFI